MAETFTTAEIISRSVSKECLDWKITGACFWLVCSPKCKIRTTPKIQHNLPDLTVAAYPHDMPWLEIRLANAALPKNIAATLATGGGDASREGSDSTQVRFKEVQVVGNPAAKFRNVFGVPFLCKSKTKALHQYFDSSKITNVIQWRGEGIDQTKAESWIPGMREIGRWPINTWGSIYPRTGMLAQAEDPKAGAVIAARAIDIVTREGQGFDYTQFGYSGYRQETWGDPLAKTEKDCKETGGRWAPPNPFDPHERNGRCYTRRSVQWLPSSDEKTNRWQMISPVVSKECETFGSAEAWSDGKESEDGNYAFNYWREYKCCIPRSGKFLTSVEH